MNLIGAWRMKGVPRQSKKDILDQGTWTANQTILDAAFGVEDIPSLATVTGFLRDTTAVCDRKPDHHFKG